MRPWNAVFPPLILATVASLPGCGGGSHSYPSAAVDTFMASCIAQPNATESGCRCVLDQLEKTMPYSEFKRVDTEIVAGIGLSGDEQRKLADALANCR
jgi:hypothetical protein